MRNGQSLIAGSTVALLVAALLALGAAPAPAASLHNQLKLEFGTDGTAGTTFVAPDAMTYQTANKRLYVLDQTATPASPKLYGFSNSSPGTDTPLGGSFPLSVERGSTIPGVAVDNTGLASSNFIYYSRDSLLSHTYGFDSTGTPLAGFPLNPSGEGKEACGTAVDNGGSLWVSDATHTAILKYNSAGSGPLQTVSAVGGEGVCYLAIDQTNNDIYFAGFNGGAYRLTAASGYTALTKLASVPAQITSIAVNGAKKSLYVTRLNQIDVFDTVTLAQKEKITLGATYEGIAVNESNDTIFVSSPSQKRVKEIAAVQVPFVTTGAASSIGRSTASIAGKVDPDGGGNVVECLIQYGTTTSYSNSKPCSPEASVGTPYTVPTDVTANLTGLKPDTLYHYRVIATGANGSGTGTDQTFTTAKAVKLSTEPATEVGPTSATLNGKIDPDGFSTTYYFEYGKTTSYGVVTSAPLPLGTTTPGDVPVSATISELEEGQTYHYRVVGINSEGTTFGNDQSFTTPKKPSIEAFTSEHVTATSAELVAKINPNLLETNYVFEYGTTTEYGSTAPGIIPAGPTGQKVVAPLTGLEGVTYHFRVVATNLAGTSTTEDQTFDFNAPTGCPNQTLRQQTGTAYLPDCRAYELVSPEQAGGALLFAKGAVSPNASDRFSFSGFFNAIPGSGEPINASIFVGDLYVSSRTVSGWVTRYIGPPGSQSLEASGAPGGEYGNESWKGDPVDAGMNRILVWDRMQASFIFGGPLSGTNAPNVYDNEGNLVTRLPTNLDEIPEAEKDLSEGGFEGSVRINSDLSHYAFSSTNVAFAPGGLTVPPGSAYDNDTIADTVTLISKTESGGDIPQDLSGGEPEEFIRIPAISNDGSHILMTTAAPGGTKHLYLRNTDTELSYDISLDQAAVNQGVKFEGMTADGSEVFFTTNKKMTADDTDSSIDLYMWSEATDTLTRISDSGSVPGNTDACSPANGWTSLCGVVVVPVPGPESVDNALAAGSGEIYFYSPELLDGARGVPNKRNLYVYSEGDVRHVATFEGNQPATRINVSPDGTHAAFLTKSKLTSFENAGFEEMYTYDPATRTVKCVSCLPSGALPTANVAGSLNGRFMTDDGRAFFSTADALVSADANVIPDVYEFVNGRPQMISTGKGDNAGVGGEGVAQPVGLVGVSADGIDAFIATYETLVGQDQNGDQYKFYDARTNGGFPFDKPPTPCEAADECHGADSSPPAPLELGTTAALGSGGNLQPAPKSKKKKKKCKKGQKLSGNHCVAKKKKPRQKRGGGQRG